MALLVRSGEISASTDTAAPLKTCVVPMPAVTAAPKMPGKSTPRAGLLRSRFDHIEDRPGTAALARVDYFEVDADDGIVFEHDTAQLRSVDDQIGAFEARRRAEVHVAIG